jgi:glycosyltransferase involved in cell wall biosynthesis
MTKLTVAICTFNRSQFLEICLRKLLPQIENNGQVRVLIIDNNSSDDTHQVFSIFHQQYPFQNNTFDVLIMNHVLEHVPYDKKIMGEILRVIKPDGFCILQVPIARALETTLNDANVVTDEGRLDQYGQKDHVRLYGNDYASRLTEAGLDVNEVKWQSLKKLNPLQKKRYVLIEKEILFVCKPRTVAA